MTDKEKIEFVQYCTDHIHHFNGIPCEFESSLGNVYYADETYNLAKTLGLTWFVTD